MGIINFALKNTLLFCQNIFGGEMGIIVASILTVCYIITFVVVCAVIFRVIKRYLLNKKY